MNRRRRERKEWRKDEKPATALRAGCPWGENEWSGTRRSRIFRERWRYELVGEEAVAFLSSGVGVSTEGVVFCEGCLKAKIDFGRREERVTAWGWARHVGSVHQWFWLGGAAESDDVAWALFLPTPGHLSRISLAKRQTGPDLVCSRPRQTNF